jgi:hypothetical protein
MTAFEETIVLRDAASVYAEGVLHGLRSALGAMLKRQNISDLIADWQERADAAEAREISRAGGDA